MKPDKKVWIPAVAAAIIAVLLIAVSLYAGWTHERPDGKIPHPPGPRNEGLGEYATTLGTIALFAGAAGFSWFWFRKRLKSPSGLVRRAGKLLYAWHKPLGWVTVSLIAIHGAYLGIAKFGDDKVYTGLAGFIVLVTLAGYGHLIRRVRNRWMRAVHRSLGLLLAPVLIVHAGGSAILAILAALAVGAAVSLLERIVRTNRAPDTGPSS
ncbi:hypothetical protein [Cohnella sp. REN36]|uniref:hypothetical protein n=1 Tax=Cohnella sp. REN36 TaxID=2887347 RepID=UPI001D13A7F9|nr:hypothetical protein [Cohnella sp. REN36]MCC3371532.1 hypothetical protein [Cohnella sp. REN36]